MEKEFLDSFLKLLKSANNDFKKFLEIINNHNSISEIKKIGIKLTTQINQLYETLTLTVVVIDSDTSGFTLVESMKSYLIHEIPLNYWKN